MSRIKSLIHEVHRRSLWQVLAIYVGVSWIVLQVVDVLKESYGLPEWFPAVALALLLIGLPIVLATAFVQEGIPAIQRSDPTLLPDHGAPAFAGGHPASSSSSSGVSGIRRLLTWRNALGGGVLAFAVWGVVSTGWLLTGSPGLLLRAEAAELFSERDRVVVADFENGTEQEALGLAIWEAVVTDLDGSSYVSVVPRADIDVALDRMRLSDTAGVSETVAVELARREGHPVVISGAVAPLGSGFQLTARIIEAATGDVAVRVRETAEDESQVLHAVEQLSRVVRRHLGESLASLRRSPSLPQVTTASLAALELYARGRATFYAGDAEASIPFFQRAIAVDTSFASAHRALAVAQGGMGDFAAAQRHTDLAYRHSERLPDRERLLTVALYHSWRNRWDSTAFYYELTIDRFPDSDVAVNNLGDILERMGRYEDALAQYRRMVEMAPGKTVGYLNVVNAAGTVGDSALADSMLAAMQERFPGAIHTLHTEVLAAHNKNDLALVKSRARALMDQPSPATRTWGRASLNNIVAMEGRIDSAAALIDTTARLAVDAGTNLLVYFGAQTLQNAALAAGRPERALPYLDHVRAQIEREHGALARDRGLGIVGRGYALAGDLTSARRVLAEMEQLAASEDFRPSGIGEEVQAIIALQEGDPERSLEHIRRARATDYGLLFRSGRFLLADTYAALGRLADAAAQYDTIAAGIRVDFRDRVTEAALRPLAHERLGELYLTMGDTTAAIRHLNAFAEIWADADPELQPRVASAQRRIAQLIGERGATTTQ